MNEFPNENDQTRTNISIVSGTMVQHYRIIEKIGAGGMGEVYLAEDTKLDRHVALKFLPVRFAADSDIRNRFMREAQAAAKLNHPNVVVIHEVGEFKGRPYFAMEHIEGLSLRDLLRQRKLDLNEIVELLIGISEGLQAAHDKRVTHRDIKPSNIVIDTYGRPKILDFGLASIQGAQQLTRTGSTMGTVQYMSPEQAEGKSVDSRSDLFSLGAVLYELIAGRAPFERDSEASTLHAIVSEIPEPLTRYRAGVSDDLQRIVTRLLERDPSRRYQTAADVRADLSRLTLSPNTAAPDTQVSEESIVVVPFENLGGDPDNEYFSDGLTEEIITDLGKIGHVRVISRKSSMHLKGTEKDVRTLGREFSVMYVLTGSVRRANDDIRINAELVEASNERQVWAERYSGTLKDIFDIQEEVARAIAGALRVKLSVSDETALEQRSVTSTRAYDLYLRARQETERWTREGLDRAHEFLTEALKLEPESSTLHAALGYNYYNYVNQGFHQQESLDKAIQCARRAIDLDPGSVDAVRLRGVICISLTGQAREGIRLLEDAIRISPSDTGAMWWLVLGYSFNGRMEKAVELAERLVQLEPFVISNLCMLAFSYYLQGQCGRAITQIEAVHRREPGSALVQFTRVQIQLYCGMVKEAFDYIPIAESKPTMGIFERLMLIQLYALQGNREKVDAIVNEEFKATARRDIQYPWHIAVSRTILGEYEEALDWLRIAVDNGFGNYRFLEELDPFLEPLRSDPRFGELVERARAEAFSNTP
jgi:serine/threonine protein kinase/Flp pilus assembly protein TadD